MVLLGGRAAEEIIFGKDKVTTGAFNDLEKTTSMVNNMICEYGMGTSLGLLRLSQLKGIPEEYYTTVILNECKLLIDELYAEVKTTLINNLTLLHCLSKELLNKETIYDDEITSIILQNK